MFASLFRQSRPATENHRFHIDGEVFEVCWRRRRNATKLTMRWRDNMVQITTPPGVTQDMVKAFIAENRSWIRAERKRLDDLALIPGPGCLADEDESPVIFYQGRPTRVRLNRNAGQKGKSRIETGNGDITIHLPADSRLDCARVLENWLKSNSRIAVKQELDDVLQELGEAPVKISVRDQKSRWGSCSTSRRMSFNWRLIMAPPLSLRYVVVHEAAHLIHHDHSRRFWDLVETLMPDYRHHQLWLKQHQIALFADLRTRLQSLEPEDTKGS